MNLKQILVALATVQIGIFITNCGGLKVGLDDETLDAAACLADPESCSSDSEPVRILGQTADTDSDGYDDVTGERCWPQDANCDWFTDDTGERIVGSYGDSEQPLSDADDTTGGIDGSYYEDSEEYRRDDGAYFMGSYIWKEYDADYNNGTGDECEQSFPQIIRLYSHDDVIDTEKANGELAWVAEILDEGQSEYFDFTAYFLDQYGRLNVEVTCSCEIAPGYGNYYPDEINCACVNNRNDEMCLAYWEKQ